MGSPKALLEYRGETFVGRLVRVFSKFCDPVMVVAGRHADEIAGRISAKCVINPDPDRGQLSSLQTALVELPDSIEAFLFTPVDSPSVAESTVATLIEVFRASTPLIVIPKYRGKRGHPVLAAGSLVREFLALAPAEETRVVVNRHADAIHYVEVEDRGVLADIDDPAAYRELVK